ncbi:MAG: SpoVA/SpoVAEb family sporulation membrane protein [Eubacteriales bacterium]
MAVLKNLLNTFIVGGVLGVLGQVLFTIYIGLLGPDSPMLITLLLVSMGLIGAILFTLGLYQKLEAVAGFGAILPFSGLAAAIAGAIVRTRSAGEPIGKAIKSGLMLVVIVVGIGSVLSIGVGVITYYLV